MSRFKLNWQSQLVLVAIFLLSLSLYFLGKQISQDQIQGLVENAGPWAPIVRIFFIAISVIATIPGYLLWYVVASWTNNIEQFLSISVALTFIASGIFIGGSYFFKNE